MQQKISEKCRLSIIRLLRIIESIELTITLEEAAKLNEEIEDIREELNPESWGECICH